MTIVSSLLLSTVGGALGNVASVATDQLSLKIVFCFSKAVDELKRSSTQIGDLIHDAALEPEDGERRAMPNWMKSLMTVAYAAEDAVDEVQYEFVRIDLEGTILDKDIRRIFVRLQMACKIDNINRSLKDLYRQAAGVGLTRRSNGGATTSQGRQDRETTSLLERHEFSSRDAKIFGREKVVSDIIATLNNPNNQETMPLVMAVVGLPGVGKTTLARLLTEQLMKEGEMKKPFDIALWVYVSKTFDVNSILRGMLQLFEATTANLERREPLIQSLRRKLKGKKYFLVLDDVWNEDEIWKILKKCLGDLESAEGSSVIVTTRSARVAEIMGTLPRCDLGILSDDQCWSIIQDRAFDIPNPSIDSEQERIGRKIAEKCAGLPLAAKILGSLMRSKNSSHGWLSILQSPEWQNSGIMSALMLSFDDLEPLLKSCFAYCSMLDRGSLIKRDELIQLWMAQGFLNPSHPCQRKQKREMEMEMEDIGNEYFDTLLKKSLFQDATKDENDVITECKMHDLVHEFAIEVARCESWTPDFNHEMDDSEIRHVARILTPDLERIMQETSTIARLRSLFLNVQVSNIFFSKLRALRVLSFYEAETQELPNSLDQLKHLRYLDLSHTTIRELPKSIGKLFNLQTLRLPYLDKCPKEVQNLINLRHLYVDEREKFERMKFEAGILGRLTNLRTLRYFNVGNEIGPVIEELGGLNQLRGHLIIDGLEHVRDGEEAKNARLVQKSHLHELTFKWTHAGVANENQTDAHELTFRWTYGGVATENQTGVLDGLEPHGELQRLNIEYFMGARFPSWIESLQNLKEIRLVGCNNCEGVPTLGHLPKLRSLEIRKMHKLKSVGAEFYGTRTTLFPELKTLDISECEELIEWMEAPAEGEVVVFPCLEELGFSLCPKLGNAPSRFPCLKTLKIYQTGLTCLPEGMLKKNKSLTYLEIGHCNELTCIAPDVFGCCESLRSLLVINCKKLRQLPDGLDKLPHLEVLSIDDCPSLTLIRITQDIASLRNLPPLEELTIRECPNLESIQITPGIESLRVLNIDCCEVLSILEVGLDNCTSLQYLRISHCPELESITITQCMPSLWTLSITSCEGLSSLVGLDYCSSLIDLELCHCQNLTSISFTEGIKSLQWLKIVECRRLLSLPSGLQSCTSLQDLQITHCPSLESIQITQGIASLRKLNISNCGGLSSLEVGLDNCTSLQSLTIVGCRILSLPSGLQSCTSLQSLTIDDCQILSLPSGLQSCTSLQSLTIAHCPRLLSLPSGLQFCTSLQLLEITGCCELTSIPITQGIPSLQRLTIVRCQRLLSLPSGLQFCTSLQSLTIDDCQILSLPSGLQSCTSLQSLTIAHCPRLLSLPSGLQFCTSLQLLEITGCNELTSIPITQGIPSLRSLTIARCKRLLSLPSGLQFCTSLQDLQITDCSSESSLVSISVSYVCDHPDSTNQPEEVFTGLVQYLSIPEASRTLALIPADLRQSLICNCGKLKYEPTGLFHSLTRLKELTIGPFWKELDAFPDFQLPPPHDSQLEDLVLKGWPKVKSLPQQIQHFTCLKSLRILFFEGLEALPEWLGNLTSLESLSILYCENLKYLPTQDAMKNLTKLKKLSILGCPLLEERCTKETGPEWPKISHIPELEFWGRYGNAETSTSSPINAENSTSSPRNAENLTSFPRNVVLDCLPCCIL